MDSSKVESVIKKLNISLDLWKVEVRAGQILLKDILTNLYPAEKEREPLPADDSLQQACEGLAGVLRELQEIVDDVKVVRSRLAALSNLVEGGGCLELNKNTVNVRELRDWVINIHQEYKAQLSLNEVVVRNICHLSNREQALVHLAAWSTQSEIRPQTELYSTCIKHLVSQPL